MMKSNEKANNGFTLVELLAVIVILAIILVIAVPKVISVIEDAKKATLESTAKMIASTAEKQKVQNTVLGKTDEITCNSVAKINNIDYKSCDITFESNKALVTITGSGKFEGLYVCNGTKTNATAQTEECGSFSADYDGPSLIFDQELGKDSNNPLAVETGSFTLSGKVTDDKSGISSFTVNGDSVVVGADGSWSTTLPLTQNVVTEVKVVAKDGEGNTTEKTGFVGYIQYIEVSVGKDAYAEEIGYSDTVTDLIIPATFQKNGQWYKVIGLKTAGYDKQGAFYNCLNLRSVVIPDTVSYISSFAFYNCTELTSITIPDSVTSINQKAFYNCTNLALTSLPSGLTSIGSNAFRNCTNLALTSLPSDVTSIGAYAFFDCTNLALVSLPSGLTQIEGWTFQNCTNLALTTLPDTVTSIGQQAFYNCTNLVLTSLPSVLSIIGENAFYGCTKLASISLPSGLISIDKFAFGSCTNLTSVIFENRTGWFVTTTRNATSGTDLDVTDAMTNATMLTSTYRNHYWYRTVNK